MKLEYWIELAVGTAFLGILGFLATTLFDIKGQLASVSTQVDATDTRISRIAEVLPEIKARVAWEEVNGPFAGVVLTSNPRELDENRLETSVRVYDPKSSELRKYLLVFKQDHKEHVPGAIAGRIRQLDRNAETFSELVEYSNDQETAVVIPANVNSDASFIVRTSCVGKVSDFLKSASGTQPKVFRVGAARNWKELAGRLKEFSEK